MSTWRAYFRTRVITSFAPYLSQDFVDARFAFFGTALEDTPQITPRWKRGVRLVESSIGEGLGRLYVTTYFPPASKARMDALVRNLLAAYRGSIDGLDWMSPETKKEAQAKLAMLTPKIGYPVRWRDYSGLVVERGDLVGNVTRARAFEYQYQIDKLGRPVDHDEWQMTPQTINAYYDPSMNEVVFPAAFLQPPFFNADADDAVNYGAIGAIIGHEISHGFDDQGSQYDGRGNLRDWWTKDDRERFAAKTKALIAQYGRVFGRRLSRQRRADAGREHRGQLGARHRVQGVSPVAAWPTCAGDRRPHRRPALLHGLRAGVAGEEPATRRSSRRSRAIRTRRASSEPTAC